jgi:hypothetical protein
MTTNLTVNFTGEIGVVPRKVSLQTPDNYNTIIQPGYLDSISKLQGPILPTDIIFASYSNGQGAGIFKPSFSDGVITLSSITNSASNSVTGNFVNFADNEGTVEDLGFSPTDATKTKVVMKVGTPTTGRIASFDSNGSVQDGGIAASNVLYTSISSPDASPDLVYVSASIDRTLLATGGSITLIEAIATTKSYRCIDLYLSGSLFPFTGGNRNLYIGDFLGVVNFTVITAATLQSPVNARWGSTAIPYSSTSGISQASSVGSNICMQYTGGTTDYTGGGPLTLTGIFLRVT